MNRSDYEKVVSKLNALDTEVLFILNQAIRNQQIKIHLVTSRVKSFESVCAKLERSEANKGDANELANIGDLVGARIVCLFRSDIERIGQLIRESFHVTSEDNKIDGTETTSFGYQSVHFVATLPAQFSGPRYDQIKKQLFEIQVRTIAMDAWAAASHYLDYKTAQGVPSHMRKDFFALSGLFYVADTHFEMFYNEVIKERKKTQNDAERGEDFIGLELNLDTLSAYLGRTLPNRERAVLDSISELLSELIECGYQTIEDLDSAYRKGLDAYIRYEKDCPPANTSEKYNVVGVIRSLLQIENKDYLEYRKKLPQLNYTSDEHWKSFEKYRQYL